LTKKVVFAGCSFTSGSGWIDPKLTTNTVSDSRVAPELWVNLCHNSIVDLQNLQLHNVGKVGASNTEIFEQSVNAISVFGNQIKYLFCQWTAMPRYTINVGFELWGTNVILNRGSCNRLTDINLSCGEKYSKKYLNNLLDQFLILHHLHSEIIKVVQYSTIISQLCKLLNIKNYFINGLCPWDQDYFVKLAGPDVLPEQFTTFTKEKILNTASRSDSDIFKLYDIMHNDYKQAGGIDTDQWINLYDSMLLNKIDTNYDRIHPGKKSNQLYFQQVKNFLEKQQNDSV
jgi:hypothetical protein